MPFRLGLVGLCTSHPEKWVPLIRQMCEERVADVEVTAVWDSAEVRPRGYAAEFARKLQIPRWTERVEDLLDHVDGVMIHSVDWDRHVEQAVCFLMADKSVLIDKPVVGNVGDAQQLMEWSMHKKRVTGGSSVRFAAEIVECHARVGRLHTVFGGCGTDEFGYGIHGYAMLCGLMGPGVQTARHMGECQQSLIHLRWADGRRAVLTVGGRAKLPLHFTAVGADRMTQMTIDPSSIYRPFLERCVPYLAGLTDEPPLPFSVLLEPELAAMAALKSRLEGGREVALSELGSEDPGYDGAAYVRAYRAARGG